VRVRVLPHQVVAGAASLAVLNNWRQKLETLRPVGERVLGGPPAYDQVVREFLGFLQDPDSMSYSILFVVEGSRV
jgi:hypothetical protein